MEVVGGNTLLPGDPRLIDHIVCELKSQGIFDQFRKECIADVDTKPAYQNLRQRVEGSVTGFLKTQNWRPDMNKNQLREMLRKNIYESGFLETGVERIVDQVVNPKINTVFLPQVEEVVYKFLGLAKPIRNSICNSSNGPLTINTVDLLPTDLDPISPDFEVLDKSLNKSDKSHEVEAINLDDSKNDEFESPPFEPITEQTVFEPHDESSNDSRISGISGLTSHDSNMSDGVAEKLNMSVPDMNNQDSQLSKVSSNSRLSIVTTDSKHTPEKMDISDDTQDSIPKIESSNLIEAEKSILNINKEETRDELEEIRMEINGHNQYKETLKATEIHKNGKTEINEDTVSNYINMKVDLKTELSVTVTDNQEHIEKEKTLITTESEKQEIKIEDSIKSSENSKTESRKSDTKYDRHRYDSEKRKDKHTDSKDRKDDKKSDKDRKEKDKDKYKSSSSSNSRDKDKNREKSRDGKSNKDKENKSRDDRDKNKDNKSKDDKDKSKPSSASKHSSRDRNRSSSKSESKSTKDSRDQSKSSKDRTKEDKSKTEDSKSKPDTKKDDETKPRKSDSSKSRSQDHSKKENSKHSSSHSSKDRKSSSNSSNKDYRDKKDGKKSSKREQDDHSSSRDKKVDSRRSADRDSNDGSSGVNNSSNSTKEKDSSTSSNKSKSDNSDFSGSNSGDSGQSDNFQNIQESNIASPLKVDITLNEVALNPTQNINTPLPQVDSNIISEMPVQQMKLKKPKIASNIFEVRKLMKIRKRMEKLEKKRQRQQELAIENKDLRATTQSPFVEIDSVDDTDSVDSESLTSASQNMDEIVRNMATITGENITEDSLTDKNTSAIVSKESWDAIEAKLSESAYENVDFNMYAEDTGDSSSNGKLDDSSSKRSKRLSEEEDCLYFNSEISPTTKRFLQSIEVFQKNSILNTIVLPNKKIKCSRKSNLINNVKDDAEITYSVDNVSPKKKIIKGKKRKLESEKIDTENNNKKINNALNVRELAVVLDTLSASPSGSNLSNGSIELPTKAKPRAKKNKKTLTVNNSQVDSPSSEIDTENLVETKTKETAPVKYARASIFKSQRYSSDDLYKPRPVVSGSSRRQRRLLNNTDKKN